MTSGRLRRLSPDEGELPRNCSSLAFGTPQAMPHPANRAPSCRGRRWLVLLLLSLNAMLPAFSALADDGQVTDQSPSLPGDYYVMAPNDPSGAVAGSPFYQNDSGIGVGGMGMMAQFGHLAGDTYARRGSVTNLRLAPYMFQEESMLFGDGQLFLTNDGKLSGGAGLGLRHYFIQGDFILGSGFYYDRDATRDAQFDQVVLATELLTERLDVRANYYYPVGDVADIVSTDFQPGSEQFVGHNIVFSTSTTFANAAEGVDLLFSTPIPGELAEEHNLEASAGWYHFQARGTSLPKVWGWKLRSDWELAERLVHMFVEWTHDSVFEDNFTFGADLNYYHHNEPRRRLGSSQFNRMTEWVRRNMTVVAIDDTVVNAAQFAINPDTGNPYFIHHVRNVPVPPPPNFPAPLGDGTVETPYQFIAEAQADPVDPDIIFVHADSVYDNIPVVLNDGEVILGEGVPHFIDVVGLPNPIPLPRATNGVNRPVLQNIIGDAVTLANNSEFSGFSILNTTGTAIVGVNIDSANASQNIIDTTIGPNSHGIFLQNVTGTFLMENNTIRNTEGNAFFVQGGTANIVFNDTIENSSGFAVLIENNGGAVNMAGSDISDNGGLGIRVANSSANVTFQDATLVNSVGDAVDIENISGGVSILGDFDIDNPTLVAFDVDQVQGGGAVSILGDLTITNRNNIGIDLTNIDGSFSSDGIVNIGAPASGVEAAINFQNSTGIAAFDVIGIGGSNGPGINVGDRAGINVNNGATFRVNGNTNITGVAGSSIQVLNDTSNVFFDFINIANRGSHGIEILNHNGIFTQAGSLAITNALGSGDSAIDLTGSTGTFRFGQTNAVGTIGPDPGINLVNNPAGSIFFQSLSGDSTGTTFLEAVNNQLLSIGDGDIVAVGGRAVNMEDNAQHQVSFDSVSSAAPPDFGIRLVDNPNGSFTVVGTVGVPGSGGTITGAPVAGTFADNSDIVSLSAQIYTANADAIVAIDLSELELVGNDINNNAGFALDALNVNDLIVRLNDFDTNGTGNAVGLQNQLRIRVNTLNPLNDPYEYFFETNTFIDTALITASDLILIQTLPGGVGSDLELTFQDHGVPGTAARGFESDRAGTGVNAPASTIHVDWDGPLTAEFLRNNFELGDGDDQYGIELEMNDAGSPVDIIVQGNELDAGTGLRNVGVFGDFDGPVGMSVIDNFVLDANLNPVAGFTFNGFGATAFNFSFNAPLNDVVIDNNRADFLIDDGTFLLIPIINGPSDVQIGGNVANISNIFFNFLPGERGIIIEQVNGSINLFAGPFGNNLMNFGQVDAFTVPAFIPAGQNGFILVNGQQFP
jgi:hypothetical protein